jgi:carotenoid cleavage dioxygenase-like enzyme
LVPIVSWPLQSIASDSACSRADWTPEYGARLGVLRRDDPYGTVRWFDIEPCFVYHSLNAHEDENGTRLVLHVIRYDSLGDGVHLTGRGSLWRWTIDLATGSVREDLLDDLHDGAVTSHLLVPGRTPGEAVFVPPDDAPGGDGWLMAFVYDAATDRSDLVVLDAGDLAAPPVAAIHLPRRVPAGFHGNWLPDQTV